MEIQTFWNNHCFVHTVPVSVTFGPSCVALEISLSNSGPGPAPLKCPIHLARFIARQYFTYYGCLNVELLLAAFPWDEVMLVPPHSVPSSPCFLLK